MVDVAVNVFFLLAALPIWFLSLVVSRLIGDTSDSTLMNVCLAEYCSQSQSLTIPVQ